MTIPSWQQLCTFGPTKQRLANTSMAPTSVRDAKRATHGGGVVTGMRWMGQLAKMDGGG